MSTMSFYGRAVPLNRERHQQFKLKLQPNHYSVAAKTNSMLIANSEFPEVSRDYPIIFIGKEGGNFTAAMLVGLGDKENLFVNDAGVWDPHTYIPAFFRRYPFVLAGADDATSLTVCVDEAYAGLGTDEGERLFTEEGAESDYLKSVMEFLRLYHAEMRNTKAFAMKLAEIGLLTPKIISIEHQDDKKMLDGFWVVDEAKLNALEDAKILELAKTGYLGLIYAHLFSLRNVARLAGRIDERRHLAPQSSQPSTTAVGRKKSTPAV